MRIVIDIDEETNAATVQINENPPTYWLDTCLFGETQYTPIFVLGSPVRNLILNIGSPRMSLEFSGKYYGGFEEDKETENKEIQTEKENKWPGECFTINVKTRNAKNTK